MIPPINSNTFSNLANNLKNSTSNIGKSVISGAYSAKNFITRNKTDVFDKSVISENKALAAGTITISAALLCAIAIAKTVVGKIKQAKQDIKPEYIKQNARNGLGAHQG